MNSYKICYGNYGKYSAIVYPISYFNPINDIKAISKDIKNKLTAGSFILFDLLLSNGDNFNRFAEVYFDGKDIDLNEINIKEMPLDEKKKYNLYYRGKIKELKNSVLSSKERYRYATIK